VHSQEAALWAKVAGGGVGIEHRLQLGITAAATTILRLTGGKVPQQADPCGMNFWKKLRHNLERQEPGVELPDLYGIGCVADFVWRGRSALSHQVGAKHSDMGLTRWDHRRPPSLDNLVLLTAQEAQSHHAGCKATGSLPKEVLAALDRGSSQEVAIERTLSKLRKHLETSLVGFSGSDVRGSGPQDSGVDVCSEERHHPSAPEVLLPGSVAAGPVRFGFAGLVGETKLVELRCLSRGTGCRILGKAEFLSPGGCQKDRVARQILDEAAANGLLRPGGTVVEGTSGSTGISLCLAAAERGYKVHVVLPDDQAAEKAELLRRFGATVQLVRPASISSPEHYVNVARRHAERLVLEEGEGAALFADQFENPANYRAHYHGTAPELWEQCHGSLDAFVMSAGTGGTLSGVGRFLKEKNADIRVCLADVTGSSLYYKVAKGVLYATEQQERSIRRHRTDTIAEGIGNDRLTANFAMGLSDHNGGAPGIDEAVRVSDQEALDMAHHLLRHEGLFLGSSAAVNCAAAVKIARKLAPQSVVATVLCDSGQRHLTKFYNHLAWEEYGLLPPTAHDAADLSFVT